jgi:hypothetical protein
VTVILTGANAKVVAKLNKAGLIKLIGNSNYIQEFSDAIEYTWRQSKSPMLF